MAATKIQLKNIEIVAKYINENREKLPFSAKKLTNVSVVSGGLCNFVYRLKFDDNTTAILKYYPPFVASIESMTISQSRYMVEKTALDVLGKEPALSSGLVQTPKLIYADDDLFILIMQDCGQSLVTLFELMKNNFRLPNHTDENENEKALRELLNKLAVELRRFLRTLATGISIKPDTTYSVPFGDESIWDMLRAYLEPLPHAQAKSYNVETEMRPFLDAQRRLEQPSEQACFVVGDLWPNSILVDCEKQIFWCLDWEVARFETPLRDLEQLNANLWVMQQNRRLFNYERIDYLFKRLQHEYFGDESADWRVACGAYAKTNFVLWVICLLREKHWEIEDSRAAILNAINVVIKLS